MFKTEPQSEEVMSRIFFILLSAVILFFLILWFFFTKKKKKLAAMISDLETSIRITEDSILKIKENAEEMVSKKKESLTAEAADLKKNLKLMQSTLDATVENARRNSILLSNISHTLRTNLNDILGFSYFLGNDFAMNDEPELYVYSENIRESGNSLMHLLNNIIDISRIEANTFNLHKQNCDLNALMSDLKKEFDPIAKQKGLQLFFQGKNVPLFSTDLEALRHILSNLLDNAIKYTEKGFVKLSYFSGNEYVNISIKDTGTGIDKAYQREIFEPFRQQSPGYLKNTTHGAGLGLPLVKKMLELIHGKIDLESDKASGTTVLLQIPLEKPVKEYFAPGRLKARTGQKLNIKLNHSLNKILVIDNDRINNLLISKMMPNNSQLYFATNHEELEKIIQTGRKAGEPFDMVIMNINFMDGNQSFTISELRKQYPIFKKTPFVALADNFDLSQREKILKAGFKAYMDKPISKEKLFNTLNSSVD